MIESVILTLYSVPVGFPMYKQLDESDALKDDCVLNSHLIAESDARFTYYTARFFSNTHKVIFTELVVFACLCFGTFVGAYSYFKIQTFESLVSQCNAKCRPCTEMYHLPQQNVSLAYPLFIRPVVLGVAQSTAFKVTAMGYWSSCGIDAYATFPVDKFFNSSTANMTELATSGYDTLTAHSFNKCFNLTCAYSYTAVDVGVENNPYSTSAIIYAVVPRSGSKPPKPTSPFIQLMVAIDTTSTTVTARCDASITGTLVTLLDVSNAIVKSSARVCVTRYNTIEILSMSTSLLLGLVGMIRCFFMCQSFWFPSLKLEK